MNGLHLGLAAETEDLGALDGFAGRELVEEYRQTLLAGEHADKLIVRRDRDDARRYRQVQRRRLVVIMSFMGGSRAEEEELRSSESGCQEQST